MFGQGVFLKGKNFDSIVIVVPLHVAKFYRVLKKLTAWGVASPIQKVAQLTIIPISHSRPSQRVHLF
jgi:hypothetical protein